MSKIHLLVLEFYELWFSYVSFLNDCKKWSIMVFCESLLCKIYGLWCDTYCLRSYSEELPLRFYISFHLHGQNGPYFLFLFSTKNQLSFPPTVIYLHSLHLLPFKFLSLFTHVSMWYIWYFILNSLNTLLQLWSLLFLPTLCLKRRSLWLFNLSYLIY